MLSRLVSYRSVFSTLDSSPVKRELKFDDGPDSYDSADEYVLYLNSNNKNLNGCLLV